MDPSEGDVVGDFGVSAETDFEGDIGRGLEGFGDVAVLPCPGRRGAYNKR